MNLEHIFPFCNYNVEDLNLWLVPTYLKSLDANLGLTCSWICVRSLFQLLPGLNSCSRALLYHHEREEKTVRRFSFS